MEDLMMMHKKMLKTEKNAWIQEIH